MPTVIPQVIAALMALAAEHVPDDVEVTIGERLSGDPGSFLSIGMEDADGDDFVRGASSTATWPYAGNQVRAERGQVNCVAVAWNGDSDAAQALADVFAILSALEAAIKQDPTLGLDPALVMRAAFGGEVAFDQIQADNGAHARVTFTVTFEANT